MRKSIEFIFNILLWSIITYIFYYFAKTNAHIAPNAVHNYGIFHIPYLTIVVFFTLLPPLINYYLFYLLLVPKVLVKKKYLAFLTLALFSSVIVGFGFRMTYGGYGLSRFIVLTIMALFWGIVGSSIKGIFLWIDSQVEKKTLEKRNLMSKNALLMLQAQINPHFLFNSLNNIDVLIEDKPKTGSEYLKKLSDILRYVLYETKDEETELSKEILQIRNYVDLQRIRTSNPKYVNLSIAGEIKDQKIAPMLFIPFIENAFKHCKNKTIENAIDISFEVQEKIVKMVCRNYYEPSSINIIKNEGLGNETIKKRLDLLYPGKHRLTIDKAEQSFKVTLQISF